MPHDISGETPLPQVNDLDADDIAAFIMARAFGDIYRDADDTPLPKPLAAILRQMQCLESRHEQFAIGAPYRPCR